MILPSAVSDWPCLVPGRRGVAPGPFLSMADPARRRARPALNALINHNCFNSINDVFRASFGTRLVSTMNLLGYFYREGGSSKGPIWARDCFPRAFAMPCADRCRARRSRKPRPSRPTCSARRAPARSPRRIRRCAGPRRRPTTRPDAANDRAAARQGQGHAGAVAHRSDPELRPAGRERRLKLRLQLAQPQAPEAEILSGAGQAETADRSRQSAAAASQSNTAAAAFDPAVGIRQQDADPAGDGRHRAGPAAAQAAQDRRRSVRRGRRLRRQLSDQVRGRILRRLRHQSRPAHRCRKASRSM